MIPKSKAPHLNRAQRRNPKALVRSMFTVPGGVPSVLLQRLLVLNGYWPDNTFKTKTVDERTGAVIWPNGKPEEKREGLLSKVRRKVGGWFGR